MTQYPGWWEGGYPDVELVVHALLQKFLNLLTPQGVSTLWLPDNLDALLAAGKVVAQIHRGGLGADGLWDSSAVQVGVRAETRENAWEPMEFVRQMMLAHDGGSGVRMPDGSVIGIGRVFEINGPQDLSDFDPDERLVPAAFHVELRLPRSLPDYARIVRDQIPL